MVKEITLNTIIYDLLEIASAGGMPNEQKISEEQAGYWIEQTRATLIAQALNRRDDISDTWTQYINCLEMEQVDSSLCCLAPSDCKVARSVLQLPSTVDTWKDNGIISVSGMDGSQISKSNPIKQKYQQYNKYTSKNSSWHLIDDYLYIINDPFIEKVGVALIAEFPSDLSRFVDCNNQSCFTKDSRYPVSISMASTIIDIILKTKVNPFMTLSSDNSNNADASTPKQNIDNKQSE